MKIIYPLILSLFISSVLTAQDTCETSENNIIELNSIKKCQIEDQPNSNIPKLKEKNKKTSSNYIPNKRFLTVRKKTTSILSNSINSKGINKNKTKDILQTESLIALKKEYNYKVLDFVDVDRVPTFKTCKNLTEDKEQRICFNKKLMTFINDNIQYADQALEQDFSGFVSVKFVIDNNGETNNILVTGAKTSRSIKESIINLVSQLPKFTPALKDKENVTVKYEFILNFTE